MMRAQFHHQIAPNFDDFCHLIIQSSPARGSTESITAWQARNSGRQLTALKTFVSPLHRNYVARCSHCCGGGSRQPERRRTCCATGCSYPARCCNHVGPASLAVFGQGGSPAFPAPHHLPLRPQRYHICGPPWYRHFHGRRYVHAVACCAGQLCKHGLRALRAFGWSSSWLCRHRTDGVVARLGVLH